MDEAALRQSRILIVDDQAPNVLLLERILQQAGYVNLKSATDPRHVLPIYSTYQPDLLILDLLMPHWDGFEVMKELRPRVADSTYFPILVVTADSTPRTKRRALAEGATDFLAKPVDSVEVQLRVRNLLQTRLLYQRVENANQILEEKVRERTQELLAAQLETLQHLALAAEYRDDETHEHTVRVGRAAVLLAREVGLPDAAIDLIGQAAPLHDLGKIGISDLILLKPGKLTTEEFAQIKTHVTIGARILAGSRFQILQLAEEIALTHHERWDGSGYLLGLKEEEIPQSARIVTVVDVFDALTHVRPYKAAWPAAEAKAEIERQSGRQFDPDMVTAFQRLWRNGAWQG